MDTETEARQDEAAYLRCQVQLLTDEVERLRLTQEEREAVMDDWISVVKSLPAENQHVVVWDSENKIAVVAYRFDGDRRHYVMNAGDGYGFTEFAVTHWLPLPAPPGE